MFSFLRKKKEEKVDYIHVIHLSAESKSYPYRDIARAVAYRFKDSKGYELVRIRVVSPHVFYEVRVLRGDTK